MRFRSSLWYKCVSLGHLSTADCAVRLCKACYLSFSFCSSSLWRTVTWSIKGLTTVSCYFFNCSSSSDSCFLSLLTCCSSSAIFSLSFSSLVRPSLACFMSFFMAFSTLLPKPKSSVTQLSDCISLFYCRNFCLRVLISSFNSRFSSF